MLQCINVYSDPASISTILGPAASSEVKVGVAVPDLAIRFSSRSFFDAARFAPFLTGISHSHTGTKDSN